MATDVPGDGRTRRAPRLLSAAVFDMDGLLVDSEPLWHEAEMSVFGRYGVALTEDLCRSTKGMFVGEVARHWYDRHQWEGPGPDEVAAEVVDAVAALLAERVVLKPGALDALSFCRERVASMALASSSSQRLIAVVVDRLDLGRWFSVVHSAEHEPAGKPDPAVFLTTARRLGVEPRCCVVLEDSQAGVAAAAAAGMRCVAVPEQPGAAAEDWSGADVVLASLEDLDEEVWRSLESRVAPKP